MSKKVLTSVDTTPELPLYVKVGAIRFPVVGVTVENGTEVLHCDFTTDRVGNGTCGGKIPARYPTTVVEKDEGLFIGDVLNLIDRSDISNPMLTLCVQNVETNESRIQKIVRDDNDDGEKGGVLWLHVDPKVDEGLTAAFYGNRNQQKFTIDTGDVKIKLKGDGYGAGEVKSTGFGRRKPGSSFDVAVDVLESTLMALVAQGIAINTEGIAPAVQTVVDSIVNRYGDEKGEDPNGRSACIERAAARLLVGVTGRSTQNCTYYDGIKEDATEELRAALKLK